MYSAQIFAERNGFQYTETKRSETGRRLGQQRRGEKIFAYLSFTTVRLRDRFVYNKENRSRRFTRRRPCEVRRKGDDAL